MVWLAVTLGAVLAGMVQTVTGFGSGVVLIMILPRFFDMLAAPAINNVVSMGLTVVLSWQYRKHIDFKTVVRPAVPFAAASAAAIWASKRMDLSVLGVVFGVFLMGLSLYFFLFDQRVRLKADLPTVLFCSVVSGVFAGLFGVGGPLMALYFVQITRDRREYVGTIQFFFTITNSFTFLTRIFSGTFTLSLLPVTLAGLGGILVGKHLGVRVGDRLDADSMKKIIYVFVGISGVITLVQELF